MLAANPPAPQPEPPAAETAALIAQLKLPVPSDTAYAETRFSKLLRKPLELRGELHYGGAGVLGKRVDAPYRETTTIAQSEVTVEREGKGVRRFALERAPELEALLASFSALLGGDAEALNRNFALALDRRDIAWRLTLTPRAHDLAKHLRELVVDGRESAVRCVSLHEADGDASVMRIGALSEAALPAPATMAALDTLCRGAAR